MSISRFVPCALLCLTSISFARQSAVEPLPRLEETVEDVETLRVLLTKELAPSPVYVRGDAGFGALGESLGGRGSWLAQKNGGTTESGADDPAREGGGESAAEGDAEQVEAKTHYVMIESDAYALGDRYIGQSNTSYTRAFYAPGLGAWIDTSVRIPAVLAHDTARAEATRDEASDAWADAKRTLKDESSATDSTAGKAAVFEYRLSEDAIEQAIAAAVRILRKHGHRVRHLGDDESVVIALKLEGEPTRAALAERFLTVKDGVLRAAIFTTEVKTQTVIVRASKAVLALYHRDDIDIDEADFRKRLLITRY